MVLHQRHLGNEVGRRDQLGLGVAAGDDDVLVMPPRLQGGELNAVSESGGIPAVGAKGRAKPAAVAEPEPKFCAIDDPSCEACQ